MKSGSIFLIVLFLVHSLHASFGRYSEINCDRWEVVDIEISVESEVEDPFEVELWAIFTGPDAQTITVPGVYNDNRTWLIRFSSGIPGTWIYKTSSVHNELDNKTGSITVSSQPWNGTKGEIELNMNNPQHFYYEDGSPYFCLAFECDWLYALDYGKKKLSKTETLLETIKDNGFNQVVMNVFAYDVSWGKDESLRPEHEYGAPEDIFPFGGNNTQPDYSALNIDFFKHLDKIIAKLHDKNMVSHLMIYVWNKQVNWPEMNSEADDMYFDYVVKRYQAFPNIIWDISKEALGYGHNDMNYITDRIQRLRRLDMFDRLVTVHDYQYCFNFPEMVDFISIQTWTGQLYANMSEVRERHSRKPVFNIEHGGYEESPYVVFPGDYTDPEVCLERNYQCVFAGTYSTYYWQASSWNVIIHDPMSLPVEQQPELPYYKHLRSLFERYDFANLSPASNQSTSAPSLYRENSVYLFLVPGENYAIHVTLPEEQRLEYKEIWFNPLTGEYKSSGNTKPGSWHQFRSPWDIEFSVLILEK